MIVERDHDALAREPLGALLLLGREPEQERRNPVGLGGQGERPVVDSRTQILKGAVTRVLFSDSHGSLPPDGGLGHVLDETGDQAATAARRAAFLAFVREGKGLVGIHAAADAYHTGAANTPFTRPGTTPAAVTGPPAQIAAALVTQGDKNADQRLTVDELRAVIDAWFDTLDTAKAGRVTSTEFAERFNTIVPAGGGRRRTEPAELPGSPPGFRRRAAPGDVRHAVPLLRRGDVGGRAAHR